MQSTRPSRVMQPVNDRPLQAGRMGETTMYEKSAHVFVEAIMTLAENPDNLSNLESYLTTHFAEWLKKYASTPAEIACEMREFATMAI